MTDESVKRATAALDQEQTVRGLLQTACRELVDGLDAKAAAISRVVGDLLIALAEFTKSQHPLELGHEYLISDYPLTLEVVQQGRARTVSLLEDEPEPNEAALLEQIGFESLLMVCLPASGGCWGLVEVYADGQSFGEQHAVLAEKIAAATGRRLDHLDPAG
ncbi:MAG TPA: GAF domain-containing protein [Gaiellaceae bacterium]